MNHDKLHKIKFRKDYMWGFPFCLPNPWITHGQCYRGNTWQTCVLTCLCSKETAISSTRPWWDTCLLWQISAFTSRLLQGNHRAWEWEDHHYHISHHSLAGVLTAAKIERPHHFSTSLQNTRTYYFPKVQ